MAYQRCCHKEIKIEKCNYHSHVGGFAEFSTHEPPPLVVVAGKIPSPFKIVDILFFEKPNHIASREAKTT